MAYVVVEDIFVVNEKDPDGKKFDKVSRILCHSDLYEMDLTLDVNTDIYPMEVGEKFSLSLTPTLSLDGSEGSVHYDKDVQHGKGSLADKYEYVMFGKVFKYAEATSKSGELKVDVYCSFGGLLMLLTGDPKKLSEVDVDQNLYLCIRKVKER